VLSRFSLEEIHITQANFTTEEALFLFLRPLASNLVSVTFEGSGSSSKPIPYHELTGVMDQWKTRSMPNITKLNFNDSRVIISDAFLQLTVVFCHNLKHLDLR
jgi:hypothetical protein